MAVQPGDPAAVEQLFNDVAPRYDRLNDLLSLGLHRQWKRQLLAWLQPQRGERWLDLCCGTGDLALALARTVRPSGQVTGLDAAAAPLQLAEERRQQEPWLDVEWVQGDASASQLPSAHFDGVVMAYGLRNLADPAAGIQEMRRVLKPGAGPGFWISIVCRTRACQPPSSASTCAASWCRLRRSQDWNPNTPISKPA